MLHEFEYWMHHLHFTGTLEQALTAHGFVKCFLSKARIQTNISTCCCLRSSAASLFQGGSSCLIMALIGRSIILSISLYFWISIFPCPGTYRLKRSSRDRKHTSLSSISRRCIRWDDCISRIGASQLNIHSGLSHLINRVWIIIFKFQIWFAPVRLLFHPPRQDALQMPSVLAIKMHWIWFQVITIICVVHGNWQLLFLSLLWIFSIN